MLELYLNWVLGFFFFLVALVVVLESLKEFVDNRIFLLYKIKRKKKILELFSVWIPCDLGIAY